MDKELEVIRVIRTRLLRRGLGRRDNDPVRRVEQYWDMRGNLLWEKDEHGQPVDVALEGAVRDFLYRDEQAMKESEEQGMHRCPWKAEYYRHPVEILRQMVGRDSQD